MRWRKIYRLRNVIIVLFVFGTVSTILQFEILKFFPTIVLKWRTASRPTQHAPLTLAQKIPTQPPPPDMPSWIETFSLPKDEFRRMNIPLVIFSNYKPHFLKWCLHFLRKAASEDLDSSSSCYFVLIRTANHIDQTDIDETHKLIDEVKFCRKQTRTMDMKENESFEKSLKHAWWDSLKMLFEEGKTIGDVLFIEENAIVAPDFLRVLWLSLYVKNRAQGDILEVALGGNSGENTINAHPDTLVVRKTSFFQGLVFAVNKAFWERLHNYENAMLDQVNNDFTEAVTAIFVALDSEKKAFKLVVPTLSRMWKIEPQLFNEVDTAIETRIEALVPWGKVSRQIHIQEASVNYGVRDVFGFFCSPQQRIMLFTFSDCLCPGSLEKFPYPKRFSLTCIDNVSYFKDRCM